MHLKDEKLLYDNTITTIAYNKVVLIVPKDSNLKLKKFSDLSGSSVKSLLWASPPVFRQDNMVRKY